jgi:hypothetical protein
MININTPPLSVLYNAFRIIKQHTSIHFLSSSKRNSQYILTRLMLQTWLHRSPSQLLYEFILNIFNMLAPRWFLPGVNFIPWPSPYTGLKKKKKSCNCMNRVTLGGSSYRSWGVRNTLFHSMKTEPPYKWYSLVLWHTGVSHGTEIYLMRPNGDPHGSQCVNYNFLSWIIKTDY